MKSNLEDVLNHFIQERKKTTHLKNLINLKFTMQNQIFHTSVSEIGKIDIEDILNELCMCINSNQNITNEDIWIEILIIEHPYGHGSFKGLIRHNLKIPKYFIKESEKTCFFDSMSYFILKYLEKSSCMIKKSKIYSKAKDLALLSKHDYNNEVFLLDIASIEKNLGLYRICILNISNIGNNINVIYKPKLDSKLSIIYLLLSNHSFYPLRNPKLILDIKSTNSKSVVGFCELCYNYYNKLNEHLCNKFCTYCRTHTCTPDDIDINQLRSCLECKRTFKNDACFKLHKDNLICSKMKICPYCLVEYKYSTHDCKFSTCSVCSQKYKNDGTDKHKCKMLPKKLKSEISKNTLRIYYDIEAYLNESNNFIPTILICQTVCNNCETLDKNHIPNRCIKDHVGFENVFESDAESNCISKFINFLLKIDRKKKRKKDPIIVIAHNNGGFDGLFVYNELIENFADDIFTSNPIKRGHKLITFKIGSSIFFKDSLLYVPVSLKNLPKMFNLDDDNVKGFFPYDFYKKNTLNYIGPIPDKRFFQTNKMNEKELVQFENFYSDRVNSSVLYDIKDEVIKYCRQDVTILMLTMEKFRNQTLLPFKVDPFVDACTIASNCFTVYLNNFLHEGIELLSIDRNIKRRYSREGITWIQIKELEIDRRLVSGVSFGGEKRIKLSDGTVCFPDGYDERTNTIYLYHGCFFHGCPLCGFDKILRKEIPGIEHYLRTKRLEESIRKDFSLVTTWSHEQKELKKNDPDYKKLWDTLYQDNLFDFRLHPGDALFGGRTNAFRLLVNEDELEATNSQILYYDFCSLYPSVMKSNYFPIGEPHIILKKDLPSISDFLHDGETKYFGLIKLRVLAPSDLLYPVLPIVVEKKLVFPVCVQCSKEQPDTECNHSNLERSWIGTYVSVELFEAIRNGYTVLELFEIWKFDKTDILFSNYINHFLKQKLEASGYPPEVISNEDQDQFIRYIEEREGIKLEKSEIKKNSSKRTQAKLQLNNLWGKFAQNPDKIQTKICSSYTEFMEAVFDGDKIISSVHVTDKKAIVDYKIPVDEILPGRYTNIPIAAFTTAYARLKLYNVMKTLSFRLLYVDTDSLIFTSSPTDLNPPIGSTLGELTDEITPEFGIGSKVIGFVSTGPKSYSLKIKKQNGEIDSIVKCKGFTISNDLKDKICFNTMKDLVEGTVESITTESTRFQPKKYGGVDIVSNNKTLKNTYSKRKLIDGFKSIPWGYKQNHM